MERRLTERQRRFVEAYLGEACGNGTKAAGIAGYSGTYGTLAVTANGLLKHPKVSAAIEKARRENPPVKDINDLRRFWDDLMDDASIRASDRIKASELFGKSIGGFTEKVHIEVLRELESILDSVEPHMSREAYAELLTAIARVQGVDHGEAGEDAAIQ